MAQKTRLGFLFVCHYVSCLSFFLAAAVSCLVSAEQTSGFLHVKQVLFHSTTPRPAAVVLMAYLLNGLS